MLDPVRREAILDRAIAGYVWRGYKVVSRHQWSAMLVKERQTHKLASCIMVVLTLGLWLIVELFLVAFNAGGERRVYLTVDEHGRVKKTRG